jgi:hypothetical protein
MRPFRGCSHFYNFISLSFTSGYLCSDTESFQKYIWGTFRGYERKKNQKIWEDFIFFFFCKTSLSLMEKYSRKTKTKFWLLFNKHEFFNKFSISFHLQCILRFKFMINESYQHVAPSYLMYEWHLKYKFIIIQKIANQFREN